MGNYRRGPQNTCSFVIAAVMYPMQVAFLTGRNGVVHSLDLCFMYLRSRVAAPDFPREATLDDFFFLWRKFSPLGSMCDSSQ